jgi:UDP-N-acetylglucosamine 1-carboxyvinyltransferase
MSRVLKQWGAKLKTEHGVIKASSKKLKRAQIFLDVVSVGATINLMLAAAKATGTTVIENAAKEPHIVDIANFLNTMGADIKGAGTDVIKIAGTKNIKGDATYTMIPDQIEAGTFMIAAAATSGDVTIKNIIPKHMESLSAKLLEMNVHVIEGEDDIRIKGTNNLKSINLKTLAYPGFPTDLQPQMAVLLTQAHGTSKLIESVWANRFQYVDELEKMGSSITINGSMAVIEGKTKLSASPVKAPDLRAGAAMVIAALVADGESEVGNIEFVDRGYENFDKKIKALGGQIRRG